jgi:diamine N-acetyltransferase
MIQLRDITNENFRAVIDMKMPEDQHFVASNIYSLAQAWLNQDCARPYAIYNDEVLVGFVMLHVDDEEKSVGIWRLMIALEHQGNGYGQAVMKLIIKNTKESGKYDFMDLYYVPENKVAEHIYRKLGFIPTGEVEDNEIIMRLDLK